MIRIYGAQLSQLPTRDVLMHMLEPSVYQAWLAAHGSLKDDRAARLSLGGLVLLSLGGGKGELARAETGRPYLRDRIFDFSISHTERAVVCAVSAPDADEAATPLHAPIGASLEADRAMPLADWRVGIDIEDGARLDSARLDAIAARWFCERELAFFREAPTRDRFLTIWTRKEALGKRIGIGLKGLRALDTLSAEDRYGVRFFEYGTDGTHITLCFSTVQAPPSRVHWISNFDDPKTFF